jgi:hypothetical protein
MISCARSALILLGEQNIGAEAFHDSCLWVRLRDKSAALTRPRRRGERAAIN